MRNLSPNKCLGLLLKLTVKKYVKLCIAIVGSKDSIVQMKMGFIALHYNYDNDHTDLLWFALMYNYNRIRHFAIPPISFVSPNGRLHSSEDSVLWEVERGKEIMRRKKTANKLCDSLFIRDSWIEGLKHLSKVISGTNERQDLCNKQSETTLLKFGALKYYEIKVQAVIGWNERHWK